MIDIQKKRARQRIYADNWYQKNKESRVAANRDRRKTIKDWFREYKSTLKCTKCGESHPACLDFHHRDPSEKDKTLQEMLRQGYSIERMKAEIAKCDVLCANCHRKVHWDQDHDGDISQ